MRMGSTLPHVPHSQTREAVAASREGSKRTRKETGDKAAAVDEVRPNVPPKEGEIVPATKDPAPALKKARSQRRASTDGVKLLAEIPRITSGIMESFARFVFKVNEIDSFGVLTPDRLEVLMRCREFVERVQAVNNDLDANMKELQAQCDSAIERVTAVYNSAMAGRARYRKLMDSLVKLDADNARVLEAILDDAMLVAEPK